ncbi:MAG TPA: FAD binding domain-containing protein [Candidatus Binatia bacterium]|nr:FAD binding domain-containing protein [Candidatus Binatia bacterium]
MLPQLQLLQPTTIAEASQALGDFGERAKIYAGGAELLLLLRQRLLEAEILIDIKKIAGLHEIRADQSGMEVGACVTHCALAGDPSVYRYAPALAYAESQVANVRVRHQGTLGGNLCFNDPHSDPGTVLLVHDASVKVANYKGERQLPLAEFFQGLYATALRPNEILSAVRIPRLPEGMASAYLRLHRYQRPTLGVAAAMTITDDAIAECRLAVGCAGPKPLRLSQLETKLKGVEASNARRIITEEKSQLRDLLRPVDDLLGSAEYKLYMTCVMLGDALAQAAGANGSAAQEPIV